MSQIPANNKNYMSIGISMRNIKFTTRNKGIGVRQESNPQCPNAYSMKRDKLFNPFGVAYSFVSFPWVPPTVIQIEPFSGFPA